LSKSLYDTLGVSADSSDDDIKKAYRRLARKYHPDINKTPEAEEKFKEINSAYEILSDREKKSKYDQFGDSMFGGQSFHDFSNSYSSNGSGTNFDDILKNIFGGAGAGGFSKNRGFNSSFNFGGGSGGFGNSQGFGGFDYEEPDLDIVARITITFDLMAKGGKKHISINGEEFDIKIPAGIKEGETLRVRGKGKSLGSNRGDILLKVSIDDSSEYERDDDDLIKKVQIPLYIAMFGGKIAIETIDGEKSIKIPENTKQNQKLRLKNLGISNRVTKLKGDLYLKIDIKLPNINELDDEFVSILKEKLPKE